MAQVVAASVFIAVVASIEAGISRSAHLLLSSGVLHSTTERLWPGVTSGARETVVAWHCVLTSVYSVKFKAGIWYFLTLIDIFAVDSIASVSCGAFSTFPGPIWKACALGPFKARTRKTSINRTGLFVANLADLCISHTLFATMFGYRIIAKALTVLDATTTGNRASIPGRPWSPATVDRTW